MGKDERTSEEPSAAPEYRYYLGLLRKNYPSIHAGLRAGLTPLPKVIWAHYLHFMWGLVSRAPESWSESDFVLDDRDMKRQRTNARLLKRLEGRNKFCGYQATHVLAQIKVWREFAANSKGSVAEAYAFAARRLVCLVGSILRSETGIHIVRNPPLPVPSPRTCILPPRPPPPRLAKVLPFKPRS